MKQQVYRVYLALRHWRLNLPDSLAFEVATACNRRCAYCVQSVTPAKQTVISQEMWALCMDRLRESKFKGLVGLAFWSEPSLVPNLSQYISDIRATGALPTVFTNGKRPEAIDEWFQAGAVRCVITEHEPYPKEHHRALVEVVKRNWPKATIKILKPSDIIETKNLPLSIGGRPVKRCPFNGGFGFRQNGTAMHCCLDHHRFANLGNLKDNSIWDIWFEPGFVKARESARRGEPILQICKRCLGLEPSPAPCVA